MLNTGTSPEIAAWIESGRIEDHPVTEIAFCRWYDEMGSCDTPQIRSNGGIIDGFSY